MSDTKSPILNSAVFLAASVGFLYCAGAARLGGYFSTLGLDADVLDRDFHQSLYAGLLISFDSIFFFLFAYVGALFLYSYAFLPSLVDWLRKTRANKLRYLRARRRWVRKRKDTAIERLQKLRTAQALGYAVLGSIFILFLAHFEAGGKREALAILKQIESGKPLNSSNIIRVKIEDQPKTLFYLGCGSRNCAGIDLMSKTIYYFPQNGHSYQYIAPPRASSPASIASPAP